MMISEFVKVCMIMSAFKASRASTRRSRPLPLRLYLWAGIIAPILFATVFTIDGALTPGYSAYNEAISYLDLGTYGWIQLANFIVFGVLLMASTVGYFK